MSHKTTHRSIGEHTEIIKETKSTGLSEAFMVLIILLTLPLVLTPSYLLLNHFATTLNQDNTHVRPNQ